MAPFRRGFLFGTNKGAVIQYDQDDGFCEDDMVSLGGDFQVRMIVALEELVVVAGIDRTTNEVVVELLGN
jgi:hypothetical protein